MFHYSAFPLLRVRVPFFLLLPCIIIHGDDEEEEGGPFIHRYARLPNMLDKYLSGALACVCNAVVVDLFLNVGFLLHSLALSAQQGFAIVRGLGMRELVLEIPLSFAYSRSLTLWYPLIIDNPAQLGPLEHVIILSWRAAP